MVYQSSSGFDVYVVGLGVKSKCSEIRASVSQQAEAFGPFATTCIVQSQFLQASSRSSLHGKFARIWCRTWTLLLLASTIGAMNAGLRGRNKAPTRPPRV